MAETAVEPISSRTVRMNQLVMGKPIKASTSQTANLMSREAILDSLFVLFEECNSDNLKKDRNVAAFIDKFRAAVFEFKKLRVNLYDFEIKKVIGMGHFGHVQVVRERQTGDVYAMKVLRKSETLAQQNIAFYEEERDIMAKATSLWITRLQYAFQDKNNIYFVMEFHPGGDLLALLERFDNTFSEDMARFYLAEIALAINALHNMGYVHRDIKPDNVLLDRTGHVKLADFGSAAKLTVHGTVISKMPVGTPDYVAPEVLVCLETNSGTYGQSCDWWSLGIVAYEMLFGETPFTDEKVVTTYSNIMNHKKTLAFPEGNSASDVAISLIRGLLEDAENRLNLPQIMKHPFFTSTNWDSIRDCTPPFLPVVLSVDDTSNFDEMKPVTYKPDLSWQDRTGFSGKNLPFVGFTFTKLEEAPEESNENMAISRTSMFDRSRRSDFNKELHQLLDKNLALEKLDAVYVSEIKSLKRRLQEEEIAHLEAKKFNDKLKKNVATLSSEVASLKKVREIENSERLKAESKCLDILEGVKEKWKLEAVEKELAFKRERDRLLTILKKCNENYKNELNEKCDLQRKYDSAMKLLENYKNSANISPEKLSRRSFSAEMVHVEKLQKDMAALRRQLDDSNEKNIILSDKLTAAHTTTVKLELQVNRLEQASNLSEENWLQRQKEWSVINNELQGKLDDTEQKLSEVKTELRNKRIDTEVMEKKIKFLCSQNEMLEDRLKNLSNSIGENGHAMTDNELHDEIKALADEKFELIEKLFNCEQNELEKTQQVDELRIQLSLLEDGLRHSSAESFVSASSGNNENKKDELINGLNSEVALLKAKITNLEMQLERSKDSAVKEKQEARETRSQLFKIERELKDAKIDLRIAQRDAKAATEQMKRANEQETKLLSEKDKLEKKISELELSLVKSESEVRKLTTRLEYSEKRWESEKVKLENQIETLNSSNSDLKAIRVKCDQAEGRIEELIKQLEMSEKQIKTLELEAKEWLQSKAQMKENLKQEIEKRQHHETNANILRSICTDLEDQVQKHESLITIHENEEQKLQETISRLENDILKVKSELLKSEKNIDKEKLKLDDANKRINELERQLEMESVVQDRELHSVVSQKNEYRANVVQLAQDAALLEEELKTKDNDISTCLKKIDLLLEENLRIKEETAGLITQIQSLRESNYKVSKGLEEAIEKAEAYKEQVVERENELQEIKTTNHAEKLKLNETNAQQTKLINFLQSKLEQPVKKKKTLQKLFSRKYSSGSALISAPLKKAAYKVEMSPSKTCTYPSRKQGTSASSDEMLNSLTKSPGTVETTSTKLRSYNSVSETSVERMRHNIPHRFNMGLCLHSTKCAVCLENITFGRNVSRCEECNLPVHPRCIPAVPDTCSLPIGLMQHYRHSMRKKKNSSSSFEVASVLDQDSSICGWLKTPKSGGQGWDRVFGKLKGTILLLYTKEDLSDHDMPFETIDLSPSDGFVKVFELIQHNELTWSAKSDLSFIFKLETHSLTTCWPGRSVYLMASSLSDKMNWVSTLEKVAKANSNFPKNNGEIGSVMLTLNDADNVDLNCVAYLDSTTAVVGSKEGIYVIDPLNASSNTFISHFISVTSIHVISSLRIVLIVTGSDHRLFWIEIGLFRKILNGAVKYMAEALQLLHPVDNVDSCHLIVTTEMNNSDVLLCAATGTKLSILKWNPQVRSFHLRRILSTVEPCSCALFTSDSLIFGTDKFYEVNLQDFAVENFMDETDLSLKHILNAAIEMQNFPLAIFQVGLNGVTEEYLVCYYRIGVFVDSFGHRSRSEDVTWSRAPLAFGFRWPYLYIIHFNCVEVRMISKADNDVCFEMQTSIELPSPRYLGAGSETGTIVIASTKDNTVNVLDFDGDVAAMKKLNKLSKADSNIGNDSTSEGNFSYTDSVLEALAESEL
ncbi:hypothetical protein CHUAL_005339 [Chamberlinius hualienensis]